MRDKEGNYPLGITSNKDKMDDLNFYLDSLKDKEKQKDTSKKGEK
jgi:hypothetical protein